MISLKTTEQKAVICQMRKIEKLNYDQVFGFCWDLIVKTFVSSVFLHESKIRVVNIRFQTKPPKLKPCKEPEMFPLILSMLCLDLYTEVRKFKVFFKILQDYRLDHVHLVITPKPEIWRTCAVPKMFHIIFSMGFFQFWRDIDSFCLLLSWKLSSILLPQISGKLFAEKSYSRFHTIKTSFRSERESLFRACQRKCFPGKVSLDFSLSRTFLLPRWV